MGCGDGIEDDRDGRSGVPDRAGPDHRRRGSHRADVGIAEELAQDALVAALEPWPAAGVPDNPGAWLMATARHRAIDLVRRRETYAAQAGRGRAGAGRRPAARADPARRHRRRPVAPDLHRVPSGAVAGGPGGPGPPAARRADDRRDRPGLPHLGADGRPAHRPGQADAGRAGVPFEVAVRAERAERLTSVLEVIYLIFNEGYSASAGDDWIRPALCEDALRLARVLAGLMPAEPEVHGLVALLEFQASRIDTRTGPDGEPVLLADQDRTRWNRMLIRRGAEALRQAGDGPYSLQAAIAACHARALRYEDTDWAAIAALYGRLAALTRRRWSS